MLCQVFITEAQEIVIIKAPWQQKLCCTQEPNRMGESQEIIYRLNCSKWKSNSTIDFDTTSRRIEDRNVGVLSVTRFYVEAAFKSKLLPTIEALRS